MTDPTGNPTTAKSAEELRAKVVGRYSGLAARDPWLGKRSDVVTEAARDGADAAEAGGAAARGIAHLAGGIVELHNLLAHRGGWPMTITRLPANGTGLRYSADCRWPVSSASRS